MMTVSDLDGKGMQSRVFSDMNLTFCPYLGF